MIRFSPLDPAENNEEPAGSLPSDSETEETNQEAGEVAGYSYMLEINYEKADLISIKDNAFNPENKFIKITRKGVQLAEAFKNYQLFN